VLVVACSQRKALDVPGELRLSSIAAPSAERRVEWGRRLRNVAAPEEHAERLYQGEHWQAALQAYASAHRFSTRSELWVISAGWGLIPGTKSIKPYSATFAAGPDDAVWRGDNDGDRRTTVRQWWKSLPHEATLVDLLRGDARVLIAAGSLYLEALGADLDALCDAGEGRVSIISAGSRNEGPFLPVSGAFRAWAGGTDTALNARLLDRMARTATEHKFSHSAMAQMLARLAPDLPPTDRRAGKALTDDEVVRMIKAVRRTQPELSRTRALRQLRDAGSACEQARFATLWSRAV
jgi:hypothetical protein